MLKKIKISIPKIEQKEVEVCGVKVKIDSKISLEKYGKISEDIKNLILYNSEVVDKYAIIHHVKKLEGTDDSPVYVKRRDRI